MDLRGKRLHDGKQGAALVVRVTPRAKHNEISGIMEDGTLKVKIVAPPVDGKANQMLVAFLSEILDIPPSKIEIVVGASGRNKLVSILDMDAESVHNRIVKYMRHGR